MPFSYTFTYLIWPQTFSMFISDFISKCFYFRNNIPVLLNLQICWASEIYISSPLINYSAATAKSLQSCLTLCDPIDGSPPGSPVPGILQARIMQWVAISFSSVWKWEVKVKLLSRVWFLATPWTAAYQAPPSMGFSRQEYWSGVPLPSLTLAILQCKIKGLKKNHPQTPDFWTSCLIASLSNQGTKYDHGR